MPDQIPFIRIFVSSPGDVNDERKIALDVIEQLPYRPTFREKVAFRVIAWDKPGAGTPMRATLTPQDAINKGLPTPAECDIVIVLFWSRMGTPFIHTDGIEYQSGTHWELLNAIEAKRPETVIYRRSDDPPFKISDADFDTKYSQYKKVQDFFKSDLFYEADGKIKRGINMYKTPDDFRRAFEIDLEVLVLDILNRMATHAPVDSPLKDDENVTTLQTLAWDPRKSPFPGLRAFKEEDAPIFFGRGYETDALVKLLQDSRFVAVVGASGSGKSSLVGAGLMPRLRANAIEGSKDWLLPTARSLDGGGYEWQGLRFTPGEINDNPFDALASKLAPLVNQPIRQVSQLLLDDPQNLLTLTDQALKSRADWAEALLFIDQFEELYTLCAVDYRAPFVTLLEAVASSERLRAVLTMRADFYDRCVSDTTLAALLESSTFPLSTPMPGALYEMITRPAEQAGLYLADGLAVRILEDTGDDPGSLALMAYALDQLYRQYGQDGELSMDDYEQVGGVQNAIGERAEEAFSGLSESAQAALPSVFRELVEIDERGEPTRRRATLDELLLQADARALIERLTDFRLLVTSRVEKEQHSVVEVAHEALLRRWGRLSRWIDDERLDLQLRRRLEAEARVWATTPQAQRADFLLLGSRLEEAERWVIRFPSNEQVRAFVEASKDHRTALVAEEERRRRELEEATARALAAQADAQQKTQEASANAARAQAQARRARRVSYVAGLLIMVALIAGVFAVFSQTQVADRIAELNAIAPGATQGAFWLKAIPEEQRQNVIDQYTFTSNADFLPVNRQIGEIPFVRVPRGCFDMGESGEGGHHCFDAPFWIGETEVTNAQYAEFVTAGGYNERRYWTDAGWLWKTENNRTAPENYNGFTDNNQPRVGVSWYEAVAYTQWLTEQLRASGAIGQNEEIRLPTESEWEYAARGPDGLTYPWGNDWNEMRANVVGIADSYGSVTAPVGSYPLGVSWVGALDMSGNVTEWSLSGYVEYPYVSTDGRNDISGDFDHWVLRGGSFYNNLRVAAASYRDRSYLSYIGYHCGLRLVLSAPIASLASGTLTSESE